MSYTYVFRHVLGKTILLSCALAGFGCHPSDGMNGINGANGRDGTNSTMQTSLEPAGENCPNGGIKIDVLLDGAIQEGQTQYICNGNNDESGASGINGTNASFQTTPEPAGENCPNGGIKIDVLLDGVIQDELSRYICDGLNGGRQRHERGDSDLA